jgi:predicted SprT family Zn-dependent metalloprotease
MDKLKIKTFTLGSVKWKVKADAKRLEDLRAMGLCEHTRSLISINDKEANDDLIEQVVWHEVTHAILNFMGQSDLCGNEEFVQQLSVLLHQFDKSRK